MKEKKLTLLITMHKDFDKVEYFIESVKEHKEKLDVLFAFDQSEEKIPPKVLKMIEKNKLSFYINGSNTGKLKLVSKAVEHVATDFFKIVDHDDELYLYSIDEINKALDNIDVDSLIRHRGAKVYSHKHLKQSLNQEEIMNHISKSKNIKYFQQTNFDTIYPTMVARLIPKVNFSRQDFHNDVFLSNFIYGLTGKMTEIDYYLYIQFHAKGQTSRYNIKRAECIVELYDNYLKTKEVFKDFDFRILMRSKKIAHYFFIRYFTFDYVKKYDKKKAKEIFANAKKAWKDNYIDW